MQKKNWEKIVLKMNLNYFPKIESLDNLKNYKFYTNEFDEVIKAEDLCDLKELESFTFIIRSASIFF